MKEFFEQTHRPGDAGHLRPRKRKLPDLIVTAATLPRALDVASALYFALEDRGHAVGLGSGGWLRRPEVDHRMVEVPSSRMDHYGGGAWSPQGPTVVMVKGVSIGLTIFELSQKREAKYAGGKYVPVDELPVVKGRSRATWNDWTTQHDFATGRLVIRAFSTHSRTTWIQRWVEDAADDLLPRLERIVGEIEKAVPDISEQIVEGERKAAEERLEHQRQHEIWLREEAERRRIQAIKDSREELNVLIERWAATKRIEAFFDDLLNGVSQLEPDEQARTAAKIERAREMVGSAQALRYLTAWRTPEERLPK